MPFLPDPALLGDSSGRERTRGTGPDLLRTPPRDSGQTASPLSLSLSQPQFPHLYSEDVRLCLSKPSCEFNQTGRADGPRARRRASADSQ